MKKSDKTILVTGLIMLVTLGGVGIWYIIDLFTIITGNFKDKNNLPVKDFL